jgi:polysaccharide export outer membrane protein
VNSNIPTKNKMLNNNSFFKPFFYCAIILICFSACSARKERTLFNSPSDIVTDTIKQVYVVNDQGLGDTYYKIKVNDLVAVKNLQNKEFGTTQTDKAAATSVTSYQVDSDGTVNLPAIGKVQLAGLTRKQATIKLQKIYADSLLVDPIIELSVVNVKVTLLGEFGKQGNYFLERDNTTLIDILGEAGGITKNADPRTLKIIRGDRTKPEIIYVNLNDINSLASQKLVLQNNDIIVLQPTKSSATSDKLQGLNNLIQPIFVIINLAVIILTFTK